MRTTRTPWMKPGGEEGVQTSLIRSPLVLGVTRLGMGMDAAAFSPANAAGSPPSSDRLAASVPAPFGLTIERPKARLHDPHFCPFRFFN